MRKNHKKTKKIDIVKDLRILLFTIIAVKAAKAVPALLLMGLIWIFVEAMYSIVTRVRRSYK